MSDKDLLKKIAQHDPIAMEQAVNTYKNQIYRLAISFVHNPEIANDITQDVFIKLWENAHKIKLDNAKLSTWLYRVTVNHSINKLKKQNKTSSLLSVSQFTQINDQNQIELQIPDKNKFSNPHNTLENKELYNLLKKSVHSLPKKQRIAFILKYFHNFSSADIAQVMNTSISAVDVSIHRAKKTLQNKLKKIL